VHERDHARALPPPRMRLSLTLLNVDPSFCHVRFPSAGWVLA
jgi:hypothetical protein